MLFSQTGGTHSFGFGGILDMGNFGSAAYSLSNGTLNTYSVVVGDFFASTFTQSGGNHTASAAMTIGNSANGTYNLCNGSLTVPVETIGADSAETGTFTQTGGTHTVTSALTLGGNTGSAGVYNITSGSLTIGTATTSGTLIVGDGGGASFAQTGGNVTVLGTNGYLGIASLFNVGGGPGEYSITNGSLTAATVELGSSGAAFAIFAETGGTVTISNFRIATSSGETSSVFLDSSSAPSFLNVGNETVGFSGTVTFTQNSGTHAVSGNLTLAAGPGSSVQFNFNGGSLSAHALVVGILGNANFTQSGGNATIGSGGLIINSPGNTSLTAAYSLQGGSLSTPNTPGSLLINIGGSFSEAPFFGAATSFSGYINNSGSFTYTGGTFNGTLENDLTGTVTISPNTAFLASAGVLNKGTINIAPTISIGSGTIGTFDNENNVTLTGGTINGSGLILNNALIFGFGSIAGTGGFTNNGYLSAINGNILFSTTGTDTNAGTIVLSPGHQFTLAGTASLTNNGTFSLANGLLNGAGLFFNAAPGSLVGPGTITAPFISTGSVSPGSGTLLIASAWTNNGSIQPTGAGSVLTGGLVTNNASIQGAGTIAAAVNNTTGTIEATGGVLIITGALTNSATGTLRASPNNKLLIQGAFTTNAGLIDLAGGTLDTANQLLNNTGTITGFGVLSTGGLTNNANITFTGGTATINGPVTNTANHTLNVKFQPALFTGNVTNNANATIKTTNTTVSFVGTFTNNGNYLSDPSTNIFSNALNTGSMTGGPGDVFAVSSGGALNNSGTFTNGGTLTFNGNITNSGTFTQTGPITTSSTATFTNTAGLATFGANAKLAALSITGGTVDLTTSKFIIEPAATSKSATLAALGTSLASSSLISSTLPANFGLALMDNAATNFSTFGNLPADANSILLSPELLGDANADGHVDLSDLSTLLNNFGTNTPAWTSGNFDHAPTIDLTDLSDVLNNFGLSNPDASNSLLSTPSSVIATPEPATLSLLLLPILFRPRRTRRFLA